MDAPQNLKLTAVSATQFQVNWDAVDDATSYTVSVSRNNEVLQESEIGETAITISGVAPYELHLVTVTPLMDGSPGEAASFVGYAEGHTEFTLVDNIVAQATGLDEVTLSWDEPAGVTGYAVKVTELASDVAVWSGSGTPPVVINGLSQNTLYRFYVTPNFGGIDGPTELTIGWIPPTIEDGTAQDTAIQATGSLVAGTYDLLYSNFSRYMRQIREDDRYWRLTDSISFAKGPPVLSTQPTPEKFIWKAGITETGFKIELVAGRVLSDYAPLEVITPEAVLGLSLTFDQLGSPLVAYETALGCYLYWFDNNANDFVSLPFGEGTSPVIAPTYNTVPAPTNWSELVLAYIDRNTNQLVYRRQADNYATKYVLPVLSGTLLEVLRAGVTPYGAFTLTCAIRLVDDSKVVIKSFTTPRQANTTYIGDFFVGEAYELKTQYVPALAGLHGAAAGTDPNEDVVPEPDDEVYESPGAQPSGDPEPVPPVGDEPDYSSQYKDLSGKELFALSNPAYVVISPSESVVAATSAVIDIASLASIYSFTTKESESAVGVSAPSSTVDLVDLVALYIFYATEPLDSLASVSATSASVEPMVIVTYLLTEVEPLEDGSAVHASSASVDTVDLSVV